MKHQALFSSKDKSKIIKVSSAAILLVSLRVNSLGSPIIHNKTNTVACSPSEDSDQPGHPPSLISPRC